MSLKRIRLVFLFIVNDFLNLLLVGLGYYLVKGGAFPAKSFWWVSGWSIIGIEFITSSFRVGLTPLLTIPTIGACTYFIQPWYEGLFWSLLVITTLQHLLTIGIKIFTAYSEY